MRRGSGNGNRRNGNHHEEVKPKFKKGDKVEVIGAFLDTVQGEILGFDAYADVAEYQVKILSDEVAMEDGGRETNPRFKMMEKTKWHDLDSTRWVKI